MPVPTPIRWHQHGAALLVTLCILLALMMLGVGAMRAALGDEKSARGERDRAIALQAAQAALADAERDIEGGAAPTSARAALFARGAPGFAPGCGAGKANPALGLCGRSDPPAAPAWQSARLDQDDGANAHYVEYGWFTAAFMPVGRGTLPARLPRYIIEHIPLVRAGHAANGAEEPFYRITAIGFGTTATHHVVLQAYYLKTSTGEEGV